MHKHPESAVHLHAHIPNGIPDMAHHPHSSSPHFHSVARTRQDCFVNGKIYTSLTQTSRYALQVGRILRR
ncbi:hypothetical protein DL89DRAFT_267668 [Linderina pennispora]|uniref:Uncharacterized protein n=1 Tax=Linderina pennispora TaxID=61395 RepID=A0A1Y1W886_9FUNG|nr:uncharacterized protein DL89DRAFT_267668 [Linderina pennispora]ORX69446.1 hypothetical protein DL89DRAFT_267668 [Linderina pennispora]